MSIERVAQTMPLSGLKGLDGPLRSEGAAPAPTEGAGEARFGSILEGALHSASEAGHAAEQQTDALARGAVDDLHGTMITAKEAEISLKLVGTIRNKLLDAFHELWRTSV